jgi:hypothetical protein
VTLPPPVNVTLNVTLSVTVGPGATKEEEMHMRVLDATSRGGG